MTQSYSHAPVVLIDHLMVSRGLEQTILDKPCARHSFEQGSGAWIITISYAASLSFAGVAMSFEAIVNQIPVSSNVIIINQIFFHIDIALIR